MKQPLEECSLSVMSFNLKRDGFLFGRNRWEQRRNLAASIIKKSNASIIGVQEMLPSMRKDLAGLLPDYQIIGRARSKKDVSEHSDIICSDHTTQIIGSRTFWISKRPDKIGSRAFLAVFPRICTVAKIQLLPSNRMIRVCNTHFDHVSGIARMLGIKMILRYLNERNQIDPLPTILMGDLNAKPNAKPIQTLEKNTHGYPDIVLRNVFRDRPPEDYPLGTRHGFHGKAKRSPIDYIFVSKEFEVVRTEIIRTHQEGRYPSDHYPILAVLRLKG